MAAAALTLPDDPINPFSISPQAIEQDTAVIAIGHYVAMRESLKGFGQLQNDKPKVFISTGSVVPFDPVPFALSLGGGSAARVHMIQVAVQCYEKINFRLATSSLPHESAVTYSFPRFYFASQITATSTHVPWEGVDADAHASVHWDLVNKKVQGPWDVRFVGQGVGTHV